uniref:Nucleoporin 58 n=1 Tax=Astyanax mexicanus TaxID=7994 RepID=A0A3B1J5F6_ASTMX
MSFNKTFVNLYPRSAFGHDLPGSLVLEMLILLDKVSPYPVYNLSSHSAPAAATGGFAFGGLGGVTSTPAAATTTTTSSLGLGGSLFAQKPTSGFSFNTPASAPAASTAASTGFSFGFGKPAATAAPFSLTTTTAATGSTGFSLNLGGAAPASSAPATGLGLGASLFSSPAATGGLLASSTATTVPLVPAPSVGLGGVDFSTSSENKSDKSSSARPEDSKALKDENLPAPICQDVDNFQKFVKEQKQVQEEISRMSSKAMVKVQDDIKSLKQLLSVSASGLQRNALSIEKLKMETAQELKNADVALRTQKTPPGLQHENTAPSDYFRGLVEQFEVQLQQYRQQIEELENHLTTQGSSAHITPQDLSQAMQKLYQTFVALAAQLQAVHENVKTLKHQYLNYRRAYLEDSTDVFELKRTASRKLQSAPRVTTGPAPFGAVPNAAAVAMAATLTQQQQPAPGTQAPLGVGFGTPFALGMGTSMSSTSLGGFGSSSTSGFNFSNPGINASAGLTFGVSNTATPGFGAGGPLLQLKKPPAGNKRGKR